MYAFSYWHAYYDSLFLRNLPLPSQFLLEQLNISSAAHMKWAIITELPQLTMLYEALDKFIMETATWDSCFCYGDELQTIEGQINKIAIFMLCEKIYGKEYWQIDKRRVQASFVHFFIIFRHYLMSILPQDNLTIQQANIQGRLPTNLGKIENLVNVILDLLKPIHTYLFAPFFQEEQQLTLQLFNTISYFLLNLPTLKRRQFSDVPKLMKFICLCNTLETNSNLFKQFHPNRKKSQTFQQRNMISSPLRNRSIDNDGKSDILANRQFIRRGSLESKNNFKGSKDDKHNLNRGQLAFFKFNNPLCCNSSILQKNRTETTFHSNETKGKSPTVSLVRNSRYRATTVQPFGIIKSRTFEKKISNPNATQRKNSVFSTQSNPLIFIHNACQEQQSQRIYKQMKPKVTIINVKFCKFSSANQPQTGRPKGWALIREYIFKRIAEKKLKRLLN